MASLIDTNNVEGIKVNKDGKQYVSNPFLLKEIIKSREQDELTPDALKMLMLMVDKISNCRVYRDEEEREDCKQQARLDVLLYWRSFDPSKSENPNPFSYFTSLITNGIAKGWNQLHPEDKKSKGWNPRNPNAPAIFTSIDNNIFSL